jgi:uncharacterized protein YecT (DUF1311 family)
MLHYRIESMRQVFLMAAATVVFGTATPAMAQTAGAFMANQAFQGPVPSHCTTTLDMQRCGARDLRAADARMSKSYAELRARFVRLFDRRFLPNSARG